MNPGDGRSGEGTAFRELLACRACQAEHAPTAQSRCDRCGAPLDPLYDTTCWEALDRDALLRHPPTVWRWRAFLPLSGAPRVGVDVRGGPLVDAPNLAQRLGVRRVRLLTDGQALPSCSFKDRPVTVAVNRALELGIHTVACPSTGNLANAVAAHAAQAGLEAWVLVPDDVEHTKLVASAVHGPRLVRVRASYDRVNALCAEAANTWGWGVINGNLRPYYADGSKTIAYDIAAADRWRPPSAIVAPMAGGALITKLAQGFGELSGLGWLEGTPPRLFGAQAAGCAPIVEALDAGHDEITPVTPDTVCRSLAIGDPVDGSWALRALRESHGSGAAVSDTELLVGIRLLARTEGIFTETAGGVTVAAALRLRERQAITSDDDLVLCLTGNGLKTAEVLGDAGSADPPVEPTLAALETYR